MIQSKSAVATGYGKFVIENIEIAAPKADEVIVKMKAAGLCHTDYDSLSWGKPIVMGHEGAGIVEQIGSEVTDFAVGDAVIISVVAVAMLMTAVGDTTVFVGLGGTGVSVAMSVA